MTIDRDGRDFKIFCDKCHTSEKCFDSFDGLVEYKSRKGWTWKIIDGKWNDLCPECAKAVKGVEE